MNHLSYVRNYYRKDRYRESYKTSKNRYVNNKPMRFDESVVINHNLFSPLLNNVEFYKCNHYGHKACDCRSNTIRVPQENKQEEYTKVY